MHGLTTFNFGSASEIMKALGPTKSRHPKEVYQERNRLRRQANAKRQANAARKRALQAAQRNAAAARQAERRANEYHANMMRRARQISSEARQSNTAQNILSIFTDPKNKKTILYVIKTTNGKPNKHGQYRPLNKQPANINKHTWRNFEHFVARTRHTYTTAPNRSTKVEILKQFIREYRNKKAEINRKVAEAQKARREGRLANVPR